VSDDRELQQLNRCSARGGSSYDTPWTRFTILYDRSFNASSCWIHCYFERVRDQPDRRYPRYSAVAHQSSIQLRTVRWGAGRVADRLPAYRSPGRAARPEPNRAGRYQCILEKQKLSQLRRLRHGRTLSHWPVRAPRIGAQRSVRNYVRRSSMVALSSADHHRLSDRVRWTRISYFWTQSFRASAYDQPRQERTKWRSTLSGWCITIDIRQQTRRLTNSAVVSRLLRRGFDSSKRSLRTRLPTGLSLRSSLASFVHSKTPAFSAKHTYSRLGELPSEVVRQNVRRCASHRTLKLH